MERWQNCVAVVTGAGTGIGAAIAKDLATAGLRVVALGRRQERLNENRGKLSAEVQKRYYTRKCDVSVEADVKATFDWINSILGGTDILVNNAGVTGDGYLVEIDTAKIEQILQTNVMGLIYCTQAAFKSMKDRKFDGHIVHINSIAGHQVLTSVHKGPGPHIYPASKFAVTAINETIRNELRNLGTKIKTTSISPGLVRTELRPSQAYDAIGIYLHPEDVAQAIMFAISTPPHVQIHELIIKPVGEKF